MTVRGETRLQQSSTFSHQFAPRKGGSDREVQAAVQRHRSSMRSYVKRAKQFEDALTARNAALDKVIGAAARRRFRDFSREQRSSSYGLTDFRPDGFGAEALAAAKKEAQGRSHELMRRSKVDAAAVEKVQATWTRRIERLTKPSFGVAKELAIVPSAKVPLDATKDWFVKRAPFDGTYSWENTAIYGGTITHHHNLEVLENPFTYITGKFGHYSRYENYDASDFDALFMEYHTRVGFRYTAPQAGKRDMWVKVRCERAVADVWLENEYGWSSSWTRFWTHLFVEVAELEGQEARTGDWHVYAEGDPDEKSYHMPLIPENAVIWMPVRVNFPPGEVFIWVGSQENRNLAVDDMSTDQTMQTNYVLEEVHVAE